jgi:hypothetical protein
MTVRNGVIIILAWMLCAGCASTGVTPTSVASEASPPAASPPAGTHAGLRVYKDPQTGEFTEPPPNTSIATTTAPIERAFSRSHEGLLAVPSSMPGGGVRVDLQGRFRSHFVATKDADGKVSVRCVPKDELPNP